MLPLHLLAEAGPDAPQMASGKQHPINGIATVHGVVFGYFGLPTIAAATHCRPSRTRPLASASPTAPVNPPDK